MADRVLITGGAGFLGINLTRYLLARGYLVRSLDIAPFDYPERNQIEEHTGDIRDRAAVDRAMKDVRFVVHTAAALPFIPQPLSRSIHRLTSSQPTLTVHAMSSSRRVSTALSGWSISPQRQCTAFPIIKEDFQAVLDAAGYGKKIITFPAAPMVWALAILEKLKLSPVYKWAYGTVTEDSFVSVEKAERVLGFTPKYSNKEALVRNFKWYVENAHKFGQQTGVSHRVPWSQGILRFAKLFF